MCFWGSLGVTLYDTRRWPPEGGLNELDQVDLEVQLVELALDQVDLEVQLVVLEVDMDLVVLTTM